MHKYSQEQINFLCENAKGTPTSVLTDMFNNHFKLNLSVSSINAALKNRHIKNEVDCRFKKGHIPLNKGVKGVSFPGMEKTQFKKGNIPLNHKPVGSERINVDGYTEIKVNEPNKWRTKHGVLWEQSYGEIPKGYVVIFADGDKTNFDLGNLILVSRRQLLVINTNRLIKNDIALTKTGILVADVIIKCQEMRRKNNSY